MTEQPRINLDGAWSLFYFPAGKYDFDHPGILESLNLTPITAKVPGNTLLDLFREGLIPNPFFGENFQDLRHFENFEWWYCGGPIELDTFSPFFRGFLGHHQFERAGRRAQTLPG